MMSAVIDKTNVEGLKVRSWTIYWLHVYTLNYPSSVH